MRSMLPASHWLGFPEAVRPPRELNATAEYSGFPVRLPPRVHVTFSKNETIGGVQITIMVLSGKFAHDSVSQNANLCKNNCILQQYVEWLPSTWSISTAPEEFWYRPSG